MDKSFIYGALAGIVAGVFFMFFLGRRHRQRTRWPLTVSFKSLKIKGEIMEFQLHEDEVLPFKLGKPINNDGEEAPIEEGSLKQLIGDEGIFTVEQDDQMPDDPDAKMIVPHAEGTTTLTYKADADLGEGVQEISLVVTGTIISAGATGFAPIQFGTPRKKTT